MFSAHCIVSPVPLYTCRSLAASFVALFSMLSSSQLMAQSQWSNGTGGAIYLR